MKSVLSQTYYLNSLCTFFFFFLLNYVCYYYSDKTFYYFFFFLIKTIQKFKKQQFGSVVIICISFNVRVKKKKKPNPILISCDFVRTRPRLLVSFENFRNPRNFSATRAVYFFILFFLSVKKLL